MKKRGPVILHSAKDILPPPPMGVSLDIWTSRQEALRAKGVPKEVVQRITVLRQMNLWVWLVLVMDHPWQFVADNEPELLKKKMNKDLIRYKGKKAR